MEADKETLGGPMDTLSIGSSASKEVVAWIAAKVSRVKLGYSVAGEFGVFEALEILSVGILGKRALWRALAACSAPDDRFRGVDFDRLIFRAEAQLVQVEEYRLRYAAPGFLKARE